MSSFVFNWKEKTQIKETLNLVIMKKENPKQKIVKACNND